MNQEKKETKIHTYNIPVLHLMKMKTTEKWREKQFFFLLFIINTKPSAWWFLTFRFTSTFYCDAMNMRWVFVCVVRLWFIKPTGQKITMTFLSLSAPASRMYEEWSVHAACALFIHLLLYSPGSFVFITYNFYTHNVSLYYFVHDVEYDRENKKTSRRIHKKKSMS